ncbi:serine/threonine-protein kinase [Polyangium spumosum]|uniref:Protein kinase n=1 Tax=Polyangium spumosum TaxID=889282 RepID=A0A6N7Q777_9BACT|nr:serine/threonine-protein kinase [Polyangium spumosum]MRG98575.1 protein kinase [Polyangium spumosum]
MAGERGDYKVTKGTPIGRGGCATVYRAVHKPTQREVAFKESFSTEYARRRMAREIDIQRGLVHPNVMPILDADPKGKWFIMPLADGDLRKLSPLTHPAIVAMVTDVSGGLETAHAAGHVHRDVTPGNILRVTENGGSRFVVADWGLVRQPHGKTTAILTSDTRFIGTLGYAAPEMYHDPHGATFTADVYSLGRVVSYLATGKDPDPVMIQSNLPEGPWYKFVHQTTLLDPKARPQSMAEVRALLATVVEEKPSPIAPAANLAECAETARRTLASLRRQLESEVRRFCIAISRSTVDSEIVGTTIRVKAVLEPGGVMALPHAIPLIVSATMVGARLTVRAGLGHKEDGELRAVGHGWDEIDSTAFAQIESALLALLKEV